MEIIADWETEMAPQAGRRYEDSPLWPTAYDQCYEEGYRGPGIQEGEASEQVRGSGVCILDGSQR
jgi:hypothetical protein